MADASEDLLTGGSTQNGKVQFASDPSANAEAEDILEDESTPDYRFLSSSSKIPARGAKDFEPHGTQLQASTLELSREAMYDVLKEERIYPAHSVDRVIYDPIDGGAWCSNMGGKWAVTVGKAKKIPLPAEVEAEEATAVVQAQDEKQKKPKFLMRLYLLPEEVLYLLERGSVDLRWPAESHEEEFSGLPLSLQAAHAMLIGGNSKLALTLEQFTVYQYLRRAGYVALRAEDNWENVPPSIAQPNTTAVYSLMDFWKRIFQEQEDSKNRYFKQQLGPLVKPGLYRDYNSIYRQLVMVPYHSPNDTPSLINPYQSSEESSLTITYHIYKPNAQFKKTKPGPPDFYISVINARDSMIPFASELEALLRQTPFHPYPTSNSNVYQKVKGGVRNVILAVVDQGIISFLNFSDAAFGANALWQRPKLSKPKGRGGFKGKARGR